MEQTVNKTLTPCYCSEVKICFEILFITLNFACKDCKVLLEQAVGCQQEISLVLAKTLPIHYKTMMDSAFTI